MLESIKFILIGILVAMLVYVFIKFKGVRLFLGTAICAIVVFTGIFAGFRINNYYNSSGGIVGQIVGSYKPNDTKQEEMKFEIKNTNFSRATENEKYSIKIQTANTYTLNENEYYTVFVNGEACRVVYSAKDSVKATYTYTFKSSDLENGDFKELATDTMTISFAFYQNYGELFIEIDNGEKTKALWESYFEKNNFIIEIKKVDEIKLVNTTLKSVKIVANDEVVQTIFLKPGTTFVLPKTLEIEGYKFNYFEINGEKIVDNLQVDENILINANLSKIYKVFVFMNAPAERTPYLIKTFEITADDKLSLDSPTYEDFEFLGWSTDKENLINLDEFRVDSDTQLYAMWNTSNRPIKIEFNESEASIDFNGKIITGNQTVYVDFADKLTITNPTLKDFELAYVEIAGSFEKETYTTNELDEIGTYEFYYKNLNTSSEYGEKPTADKTITIKLVFVSTVDEILTMENKIYKELGVKSEEITEREDEQTFLKTLYSGLSRDEKIYTVAEYRQKLAEMFSFEYNENCTFEEYLKTFIEKALFEYKVKIIINNEATTKTVVGKNTISIETPIKQGYFTIWKIEGMTSSHKKYYAIGSTDNFIEIPAEQTSIEFEAEDWIFLKDLSEEGGEIVLTATFTVRQYYIEYDLDGGLGDTTQTIMDYDKTFTLPAPVKTGYIFTGWTITNMDHCEHIFGDKTTTDATINLTTATEFKNLNSTSGKIKFTANWKVDPNYRGGR